MDGYVDGGDVHTNSGIPNHAFYVLATTLGGNAWDAAGPIWYATLRDARLTPTATFQEFARLSVRNAIMVYGAHEHRGRCGADVLGGGEGATLSAVRIRVRRVGGIAGNIALAAELETADLPSDDAARLEEALGGLPWGAPAARAAASRRLPLRGRPARRARAGDGGAGRGGDGARHGDAPHAT